MSSSSSSSLRRSGRTRVSASGLEEGMDADEGSPISGGEEGYPRRKRKRGSSEDAAGSSFSPEPGLANGNGARNGTEEGANRAAGRDTPIAGVHNDRSAAVQAAESESPTRTRSSRKITLKAGGLSRPTKVARGESDEQDDAPAKGVDGLGITRPSNGMSASPTSLRSTQAFDLKAEPDTDEAHDDMQDEGDDLFMDTEDKKKLSVVIRAFAPDLLRLRPHSATTPNGMDSIDPRRRGAERRARASETLDDLLAASTLNVRKLRDHFHRLQAPLISPAALRAHLSGSHILPARDTMDADRRRLAAISTCLSLVDEIARRARDQRGGPSSLSEPVSAKHGHERARRSGQGVFALHMRLPDGDYFTNAVRLSVKEAAEMDTSYADLISIGTDPVAPKPTPIPTLGERLAVALHAQSSSSSASSTSPHFSSLLSQSTARKRRNDEEYARPVSHLYQGPWLSSLGPSYDSFDGQLSYRASAALWRAKRQERIDLREIALAQPSLLGHSKRQQLEENLRTIAAGVDGDELGERVNEGGNEAASNKSLDVDAIMAAYDDMPDLNLNGRQIASDDLDGTLERNAMLLRWLQELQEQRWRRVLARSALHRHVDGDVKLARPDANENAIARHLLDSLAKLLMARPRASGEGGETEASHGIVPSVDDLQTIATSAVVDPALLNDDKPDGDRGQWGTLDETAYGPTAARRSAATALHTRGLPAFRSPAALRDNETLRLTSESEDKAAAHTIAVAGATLGAGRDRGKGLLDRFANARKYTLENHPHDRKPTVPPAPTHYPTNGMPHGGSAARPGGAGSPPVQRPGPGPGRPPYGSGRSGGGGAPTMSYAGHSAQYRPGVPFARPASGQWQNAVHHQHGYAAGQPVYRPHPSSGMAGSPNYRPHN